ncbi:MAG: acylphosphatase [Pyrinomonadaceae bacterium]
MAVARRLYISGLVQGVGFRYFALRVAARHQVRGYVRNLPDGRVEAFVQGNEPAVKEFIHDIAAGPRFSRVAGVEELVVEPSKEFSTFRIDE